MLCSIRQFSRCGIRSQMWVRNSSTLEVIKHTFPAKGNSKCGDEEQEVVNLMLNYFKCGDEERRRRHSEFREWLSECSQDEVGLCGFEGDWKRIVGDWDKIVGYWKGVESKWRKIEAECREIEAESKAALAWTWASLEAKAADIKAKEADSKAKAAEFNVKATELKAKAAKTNSKRDSDLYYSP